MHPRHRYRERAPDYARLAAEAYPPLRSFFVSASASASASGPPSSGRVDWSLPGATAAAATAVLRGDFGVREWSGVPPGLLVPSLTRSLNYVHWAEDLVDEARSVGQRLARRRGVAFVDVGCGASLVLTVLAWAMHRADEWRFLATEADAAAWEWASARNAPKEATDAGVMRVVKVEPGDVDFGRVFAENEEFLKLEESIGVVVCNPPFFEETDSDSEEDLVVDHRQQGGEGDDDDDDDLDDDHDRDRENGASGAPRKKHRQFGGAAHERVFKNGGELGFAVGMLRSSVAVGPDKGATWYTCMFGRKWSFKRFKEAVRTERRVEGIRMWTLQQGKRPRWVVAWTFVPELAFPRSGEAFPSEAFVVRNKEESESVGGRVQEAVRRLAGASIVATSGADPTEWTVRVLPCSSAADSSRTEVTLCIRLEPDSTGTIAATSLTGREAKLLAVRAVQQLKRDIERESRMWRRRKERSTPTSTSTSTPMPL